MTTPQSSSPQGQHKHACSLCARRKVKCNKADPYSNCDKAKARCLYEFPIQPRPRKRAADEDLLNRLAAYEELMRKHNIDYSRYARTWVTTGPNGQVKEHESASPVWTLPTISHDRPWTQAQEEIPTEMERCLWASLPPELKYPPYQSLPRNDDGIKHPGLSMSDLLSSNQPGISQVHPEPRQIYRSWQVFVESVNPLLKIIHVPTLQQRVLDASWNPDSELTSTPTGAAIRIGQKIGLHLHKAAPKISAFDGEMRVRLWWQLYGIDARTRAAGRSSQPSAGEFGNVCLPLNVNDADLHPEMTELPTEHTGPTEMTCVLVKFEVTNWVRSSARAFVILDLCSQGTARGTKQTGLEEKAIDELEARYHDKFLRYLDHNVPLHALMYAMA
ncbi:C6 zinc finger domain-containing protein [Colletotrichum graminicola]|nr:C6 zinc finger domain-containing protein [Colletotrichum graminicola]